MRHLITALGLLAAVAATPAEPTDLRGDDLMKAVRAGGYTIVLRHARTDHSVQEAVNPIPTERYDQRNLSDEGVKDARLMGAVFKKYGISFSEIIASPMFRAKETAEYAAGKPSLTMTLRAFPSTPEQAALVAAAPAAGTNRLLVTHHFVIETHVPGIKPGEIEESEAVVVRSLGNGKVELVGKIKLADWAALAGAGAPVAPGATAAGGYVTHGGAPPASASASAAPKLGAFPNTALGHLSKAYIDAFNTGDTTAMKTYIESYLDTDANRPTAARLASYAKLFGDLGPLTVNGVESESATEIVVVTESKTGPVRLTLKASATTHMHAASISFSMMQRGSP